MTETMLAAIVTDHGVAVERVARPVPGPEQVLVRVRAASLNRADLGVAAGHAHGAMGGPGTVLGIEFAGEVVACGAGVAALAPDLVPGARVMCSGGGGYAEYAVTDLGRAMPLPDSNLSWEQATTLPVALATMHDALVSNGGLVAGEAVMILGASSGVGLVALQIAKFLGAGLVIGTSGDAAKRARLAEFGADLAIDTKQPGWQKQVLEATGGKGVALVIDQVSGATINAAMAATAIRGRIVNVGRLGGMRADFDFDLHALRRISYIGVTFRTRSVAEVAEINARMRTDLEAELAAGRIGLPVDRVFAFDDAAAALEHMRANRHFGKLILQL